MAKKNRGTWYIAAGLILSLLVAIIARQIVIESQQPVTVYTFRGQTQPHGEGQNKALYIPARTRVTESMIQREQIPKPARHPLAITDPTQILGSTLVSDVYTGQQVITPLLSETRGARNLAYYISEGKRAVAIPATNQNSFGGNIVRGDRVDIIGSFNGIGNLDVAVTKTILYNVPIIHVAKAGEAVSLIVIEVSPFEAELVNFALSNVQNLNFSLVPYNANRQTTPGMSPQDFLQHFNFKLEYNH